MGRSGKGLTDSLDLSAKRTNKKQKARITITDITNQDFSNLLKEFRNFPYLVYKKKHICNGPTEAYFFLIKQVSKLIKRKNHVLDMYRRS